MSMKKKKKRRQSQLFIPRVYAAEAAQSLAQVEPVGQSTMTEGAVVVE